MPQNEIKDFVLAAAGLVERFEERGDKAVQTILQSTQSINQSAQNMVALSQQTTNRSLESFRAAASEAIGKGLAEPIINCDKTLQSSAHQVKSMTDKLEQQMRLMQKMHTANAWKAFIASAIASVVVIGVATFTVITSRQEMKRADWVTSINAAVANGKLSACTGDGGICANIDKKQIRLDK